MRIIAMIAIGRLLVWVLQTSGPTKAIFNRIKPLRELLVCDFCMGCWVFPWLAWLFNFNLLEPIYVPIFSEIITGIAVSFAVRMARLGWMQEWGYEEFEH